ncbi:MAG TPA: SRPBCC family protein [Ktedonobacteraceae bacterium]|nr:SRPBCC family protein [Ktedonobacteraceae bacterium]
MPHAEESITINRPIDDVFNFILDGTKNPLWRPSVVDIQRVPGKPSDIGAVFKQGLKGPGGRRIDGDYEIVECQPDELIKFQVIAGPARPTGMYRFESVGNSTRVTFTLHLDAKGLAWLMSPMITQTMKGEVSTLSNLKAYLESHKV